MAGGKETPRQKMIGMMYLVLTALLALNISKEVLNGFVKVENSLQNTQHTLYGKVEETKGELETKFVQNQEKVRPFKEQADQVSAQADELIKHITELKARCLSTSEGDYLEQEPLGFEKYLGKDEDGRDTILNLIHIQKKDEYQMLTTFLVGSEPQAPKEDPWSAKELRQKLEQFRDNLKGISFRDSEGNVREMPDYLKAQLDETFTFEPEMENGVEVTWEAANFFDVPLAAVMPLMTKMKLDIQDVQQDIITWLLSSVDAKSYKFTALMPLVVPESSYILRGDTFRADVLLAAYDPTNRPEIYVGDRPFDGRDSSMLDYNGLEALTIGGDNLGKLRIPTNQLGLGEYDYKGLIRFQGPDGAIQPWPYYTPTFTVAEPALVVSPTKMNVFYRGVPNPVEISVPGVPADKITATISGDHKLEKQPDGTFVVRPGKQADAKITVSAELPDGTKKTLPAKEFRVKRIPDPVPTFASKTPSDAVITKSLLIAAPGVSAAMDNFDFDVKVTVKSFQIAVNRDGQLVELQSRDNRLTSDMSDLLSRVGRGTVVYIENIMVSMPDGSERQLATIKLKVT